MAQQIFKGFKQLSAAAFSAISPEVGVLYFIRTSETKEDGYLYFNGKKYGTAKDADSALKEVLGNLPSGEKTFAGWINKEVAARTDADAALQKAIADEVSARTAAVETLQSSITLESAARVSEDNRLNSAITTEVSDREAADQELQNAINAEATARTAAVEALQNAIDAEVTARTAADKALLGDATGTTTDGATIYDVKRHADALAKSEHTHNNKEVLDGISAEKVSAWDAAEQNAKSYADSKIEGLDAAASAVSADETIASISEENGIISASKQKIAIVHTQVTDWDTELVKKQDALKFMTEPSESNKVATAADIADIAGAMHFVGVSETNPATSGASIPSHEGAFKAGDVCLWGVKEFIYTGDGAEQGWKEIGDEGLYVTKATTIAGVEIQSGISKENLLKALNVADGAQVNKLEKVKVNGTDLNIVDKAVDVTVTSGSANGTIAVNGADVKVTGFDDAINRLEGAISDAQTAATKYTDDKVAGLDAVVTGESSGTTVVVTEVDGVITNVAVKDHISAAENNAIKMNADGFFAAIYYEDEDNA